jgi:hypothetical protein
MRKRYASPRLSTLEPQHQPGAPLRDESETQMDLEIEKLELDR